MRTLAVVFLALLPALTFGDEPQRSAGKVIDIDVPAGTVTIEGLHEGKPLKLSMPNGPNFTLTKRFVAVSRAVRDGKDVAVRATYSASGDRNELSALNVGEILTGTVRSVDLKHNTLALTMGGQDSTISVTAFCEVRLGPPASFSGTWAALALQDPGVAALSDKRVSIVGVARIAGGGKPPVILAQWIEQLGQ